MSLPPVTKKYDSIMQQKTKNGDGLVTFRRNFRYGGSKI